MESKLGINLVLNNTRRSVVSRLKIDDRCINNLKKIDNDNHIQEPNMKRK